MKKKSGLKHELGARASLVQNALLHIPQIRVVGIREGNPRSKDLSEHFPAIEFTLREGVAIDETAAYLVDVFGDWASYTSGTVRPQELRDLALEGRQAVVQFTRIPYRRFGIFSAGEPGFRILSTIPRGLMSAEDEEVWWARVLEGLQGVGLRFNPSFRPTPDVMFIEDEPVA